MIYEAITTREEIDKAQGLFASILTENSEPHLGCMVVYEGGNEPTDLYWSREFKFFYGYKAGNNLHRNIFGIERPLKHKGMSITCEINAPVEGRLSTFQGIFLRDQENENNLYIAHHGRFSITGVGGAKNIFFEWVREKHNARKNIIDVQWPIGEPSTTEAILIGKLDGSTLPKSIKEFVKKVWTFRNISKGVIFTQVKR
ncbi:MAG: hypothetical protein WC647_16105 [Desulfomonilaceae bacterium]|jgi:hypothetical protein